MRIPPTLSVVLAAVLLSACNGDRGVPAKPDTPTTAPDTAAAPAVADADSADVTMRYDCGSGVSVAMLQDGNARATVPGQPTVDLGPITNSVPPVFTGTNLHFTIGDSDAHLAQDNGTELTCQPQ